MSQPVRSSRVGEPKAALGNASLGDGGIGRARAPVAQPRVRRVAKASSRSSGNHRKLCA